MARSFGIGLAEDPGLLCPMVGTDENLPAVDDVLISDSSGVGLDPSKVGSGLRLGEELPGADHTLEDGWKEVGLLLLAAPDKDGCAPELAAAVVVGG